MGRHLKDQPPPLVTMQTSLWVASVGMQTQGCERYEVGLRPLIHSLEADNGLRFPKRDSEAVILPKLGEAVLEIQWRKSAKGLVPLPSCPILRLYHLEWGERNVCMASHLFQIIHQCWRVIVPASVNSPVPRPSHPASPLQLCSYVTSAPWVPSFQCSEEVGQAQWAAPGSSLMMGCSVVSPHREFCV